MDDLNINERISLIIKEKSTSATKFAEEINFNQSNLSKILRHERKVPDKLKTKVLQRYKDINRVWLLTGEGEMLKTEAPQENLKEISFEDAHKYPKGVLIPYFADTYTRGGLTDRMPPTDIIEKATSYINAGSLFAKATSALKHFGDSMIEYPSGCILFCREVEHPSLLVNGLPYVIETKEYRVTKKIHDKGEFIRAFSTNEQKFPDGSLIYAPFDIPKSEIIRLHQILGYAYLCI